MPTTITSHANAIAETNEKFMIAFRKKDAATMARCYTEKAAILPPQSDFLSGANAIEGFWRAVMNMGITDVTLATSELVEFGDAAYEVGRYTLLAGEKIADRGKYVVIWHHERGAWKLHRDIWNTSVAA